MGRVGDGSGNGLGVGEPGAEFQRQKLHIKSFITLFYIIIWISVAKSIWKNLIEYSIFYPFRLLIIC